MGAVAFVGMVFLIYGSMHLYALGKVWMAFPPSLSLGLALISFGLVMTLSPFMLWFLARQNWHSANMVISWVVYVWMGFLFLFCSIALVFDFGNALVALFGFKWNLGGLQSLQAVGLLAIAALGYGLFEARQIQVVPVDIVTPKLSPAIGSVTIAQISDLHLGVMLGDEFVGRVVKKLCEIKPDIIVATGDIVDGQGDDLHRLAERFHACKPPKGAYAVLGNHEYYAGMENSLRFMQNAGFTVLRGEAAAAAGGVVLAGVDDPSGLSQGKETKLNARAALSSMPKDAFIILLKHQPVADQDTPFDLQLSGHIHGGQIFPFGIIPWLTYGVHSGLTKLNEGKWLYVSRGTGTWGPPVRLFASPEITLIRIEAEKKQSIGRK